MMTPAAYSPCLKRRFSVVFSPNSYTCLSSFTLPLSLSRFVFRS
jgi:hypothetical protein